MKKGIIFVLLLCLLGCSKNNDDEEYKTAKTIKEAMDEKGCQYYDFGNSCGFEYEAYLGFDPFLADNIVETGGYYQEAKKTDNSTYQSILVYHFYISIENGKLSIIDIQTGKQSEYQSDAEFKALAISSDCDGVNEIMALDKAGEVYQIEALEEYVDGEREAHCSVEPLNLNEKVSALAVKEYASIGSTCGSMAIYVVDEQGVEYAISKDTDENGQQACRVNEATMDTAYVSFINLSEVKYDGTTEYPVDYLLLMLNKTVRLAQSDQFNTVTLYKELEDENGNPILAQEIIAEAKEDNTNAVYILSEDGLLYFYDNNLSLAGHWTQNDENVKEYTLTLNSGERLEVSK